LSLLLAKAGGVRCAKTSRELEDADRDADQMLRARLPFALAEHGQ